MDAPKIASELLLLEVANQTINSKTANIVLQDIPKYQTEERLKQYVKFLRSLERDRPEHIHFSRILPKVDFKTDFFKDVYDDMFCSIDTFAKEYLYKNKKAGTFVKLAYGKGGLHSVNKNQCYFSSLGKRIITLDFQSLYPNLYINYGYFHKDFKSILITITRKIKQERLQAKKNKDKVKDKALKLQLNSLSGLLDNKYSWLYAPEEVLALRLHGQLILSRLIEECGLIDVTVLSANTDGIEIEIYDYQLDQLEIVKQTIEKEFNLVLEQEEYKSIRYKTVNDYIAETVEGKIKQKGEFVYKDERYEGKVLDGSNEFNVIPIALEKYFINGIPIEETIRNHTNIYDFCASKKVNKSYNISFNGQEAQQLNRYFISKEGGYLYKQKKEKARKKIAENQIDLFGDTNKEIVIKGNLEAVLKKTSIYILNEQTTKVAQEFPIDYGYYEAICRKTIELFESKQTYIS